MLHADNGYPRHGNLSGSLVRSMVSTYLPAGTNVCDSRSEEFEGSRVCAGG